jgi:hypothetical protein
VTHITGILRVYAILYNKTIPNASKTAIFGRGDKMWYKEKGRNRRVPRTGDPAHGGKAAMGFPKPQVSENGCAVVV